MWDPETTDWRSVIYMKRAFQRCHSRPKRPSFTLWVNGLSVWGAKLAHRVAELPKRLDQSDSGRGAGVGPQILYTLHASKRLSMHRAPSPQSSKLTRHPIPPS